MQFDHYKLHVTFPDGTTYSRCSDRLAPLMADYLREVDVEPSRIAFYKVFGSNTEAGPYELLILED